MAQYLLNLVSRIPPDTLTVTQKCLLIDLAAHMGPGETGARFTLVKPAKRLGWRARFYRDRLQEIMDSDLKLVTVSGKMGCYFCPKRVTFDLGALEALVDQAPEE